ncbi:MAG TPA: hypothetical protein PLP42_05795 [Acidobacteriota bacterium]|nr:hypothetical protein [Acidobacteriota bacterium]
MKRVMLAGLIWLNFCFIAPGQPGEQKPLEQSRCHCFIDYENIWTFEMVQNQEGKKVPILNIITFTPGQWEVRPNNVLIFNKKNRPARVEKFSLDTGIAEEPYISNTLKVLGNGFIGVDLVGNFEDHGEPTKVQIDLGDNRFELQPVDCLEFEMLAEQINKINVDSPKIKEDFDILKIQHMGKKSPKPRAGR